MVSSIKTQNIHEAYASGDRHQGFLNDLVCNVHNIPGDGAISVGRPEFLEAGIAHTQVIEW